MAFRVILIENEVSISLKLNNFIVQKNGEEIWIPLDDISIIVMDNVYSSITLRLLSQLAEKGIGLVVCDNTHLPVGYYGSYDNHSRSSKVIGCQINQHDFFYDNLWQDIIRKKITNQGKAIKKIINDENICSIICAFANEVEIGDRTNRESYAAKVYFNSMMGTSFSRGNDSILLNSGLDYGYAIIRSYIARLCVGYGLNTQIGIHHKNEYNRFNLVDDLMEPIRPFVDIYVYQLLAEEEYFKPEHRRAIVNILNHKVIYRNKKMFVGNMLENYIEQICAFYFGRIRNIDFPNVDNYLGECKDEV